MLKISRKSFVRSLFALTGLMALNLKKIFPSAQAQSFSPENNDQSSIKANDIKNFFPHARNNAVRYFNTGSIGPSSQTVIDHMHAEMLRISGAMVNGRQSMPKDGMDQWQEHKQTLSDFIGCSPDEIALTRNTTEGVNIVCNGLPKRSQTDQKYCLITTSKEHIGNSAAWVNRAKKEGDIKIVSLSCNKLSAQECHDLIVESIRLHSNQPIVLSIPHVASDGYRFPVEKIGESIAQLNASQKYSIVYFIDGAQSLGMLNVDVKRYKCHAYAASGHKWLCGPKGTGVLYVSSSFIPYLQTHCVGAYSSDKVSFNPLSIEYAGTANRYIYGTQTTELFAGLTRAAKLMKEIGITAVENRCLGLTQYFRDQANIYNRSQQRFFIEDLVNIDSSSYSAMVTFAIMDRRRNTRLDSRDLTYSKIARVKLNNETIQLRLRHIHEDNLDGIRASFHIFHDRSDIDLLMYSIQSHLASLD